MLTFEDYVNAYATRLARLAAVMCTDSYDAQDVVQEVLLRAYGRWQQISALPDPHAYVRRMVVNEVISTRRKWGRAQPHPVDRFDLAVPDQTVAFGEQAALLAAVGSLPPRQRAAVVLRYFEDLTDAEIAQALTCRATTVRGYIHRALKTLRIDATLDPAPLLTERIPSWPPKTT